MSIHEYIPQKWTEICLTVPSNIFQFTELKFSKMSFITGYSNEMTVCLLYVWLKWNYCFLSNFFFCELRKYIVNVLRNLCLLGMTSKVWLEHFDRCHTPWKFYVLNDGFAGWETMAIIGESEVSASSRFFVIADVSLYSSSWSVIFQFFSISFGSSKTRLDRSTR